MDNKKRILIVDDEQINLEFFDVMLTKLGFAVGKAEDGEKALHEVKHFKPDLIILDNIMPKLSGWEVTKIIKTNPEYAEFADVPIIMFSAMDDVKDKVEGFELGIDDYITKPYNFSEVLARIRALLRTRELIHQLEQRERRIALSEKLNDGLLEFVEGFKSDFTGTLARIEALPPAQGETAAFLSALREKVNTLSGQLGTLDSTVADLKAEVARIRKTEIEIRALRQGANHK